MFQIPNAAVEPALPPPGEVHVWGVRLSSDIGDLESLHALLSMDEREKASRFVFERDKIGYVAARGMLRRLLGGYLNIDPSEICFSYGAFGKPKLTGRFAERLRFNLSHAGGWAAYAVSRERDIGIDIEPLRNGVSWQQLAPLVFSPKEQAELTEIPTNEKAMAFLRGWTRKEAYVKGLGEGLSLALESFDVPLGPLVVPCRVRSALTVVHGEWWLYSVNLGEDVAAALAVEGQPVRLEVHRWCLPRDSPKTREFPCSGDGLPVFSLPAFFASFSAWSTSKARRSRPSFHASCRSNPHRV